MKINFKTSRLIVGVLTILLALTISSAASAKNPKEVKMEIKNDKLTIITPSNENDCPWYEPRDAGCIKVKKNEKSEIWFHLVGETKCGLEAGTRWELNKVYLGGYNSPEKPDEFGFVTADPLDFAKVNTDFNVVDIKTGEVTLIDKKNTRLAINNINQSKYIVWYKIEAMCPRSDGGTAHFTTSDPRIRNGGTE